MSIASFYAQQEILITGGTGFIGKVLIEKILRSLPDIGKVYILMRSKKGKNAHERLQDILKIPVFRRTREEQPEAFKKLVAIDGDCQELGLAISSSDLERIRNVSVIFHVAATVRFDDDLKTAILLNTRGTHEMVKIALCLKNLRAFIHVSTTYSHPDVPILEEKMYPAYADWRAVIKLAETYDEEILNIAFSKYVPKHPNTYTFTKSLAEHIINDYRHKLPVAIFRPSIVISSLQEPIPGWVDNFNGPVGMFVACGIGILRTNFGNPDIIPDVIPVDMCAKALLVAAYKLELNQTVEDGKLEVFNCCNSSKAYLNTGDHIDVGKKVILQAPFEKCIWLPEGSMTRCPVWHYYRLITLQIIPALLLDLLMRLAKKPPFLFKLQRRICFTTNTLGFFMNTQWTFNNEKFRALENLILNDERSIFKFLDFCDADQELYYTIAAKGVKEFLLKEYPESSFQAHLRIRTFQVLHYLFQFIGLYYIAQYLLRFVLSHINSHFI